jgi:cell division protein FtsZ
MTINLSIPKENPELKPKITVIGVGGAGGNAVNNMIRTQLEGVDFVVANTDSQALSQSRAHRRVQLGVTITQGLGAGSRPDIGRIAAEEALEEIVEELRGSNMVFIAAGMGGGTGTGAAPVIARAAREQGILTVGVVTKPFHFEGAHRMRIAEQGIDELGSFVDTLIIIPNQNLFRVANEKTTFADAFQMADDVLHAGVSGVTDLMVKPGLINLDFADIRAVMSEMGKAMMGTGEATGDRRALQAAEAAISNPLLDDSSMKGARGILINITGGPDLTLFEVDEAANRIRSEVDPDAYIIFGSTFDESMENRMRVSVVATGMDAAVGSCAPTLLNLVDAAAENRRPDGRVAAVVRESTAHEDDRARVEAAARVAEQGMGDEADRPALEPALAAAAGFGRPAPAASRMMVTPTPAAAATAADVFIPPPAVTRSGDDGAQFPEPFAAAMINGERTTEAEPRSAKARMSGLFARVTGGARVSRPQRPETQGQPMAEGPAPADRPRRLGGVSPDQRLPVSQPSEDLLDIPAFLRRQAN